MAGIHSCILHYLMAVYTVQQEIAKWVVSFYQRSCYTKLIHVHVSNSSFTQ
jgi:hypothetical protein